MALRLYEILTIFTVIFSITDCTITPTTMIQTPPTHETTTRNPRIRAVISLPTPMPTTTVTPTRSPVMNHTFPVPPTSTSTTVDFEQVDVMLSTVIHCIYLTLSIFMTAILFIKVRVGPPNIRHFAICKVLTLDRLSYIILFGTTFKIFIYFPLQFASWSAKLPCNPDGRFLFWAIKIAIQFFVALRSRFSLTCDGSSNWNCKWYKIGLVFIALSIVQFIAATARLIAFRDLCAVAGTTDLWRIIVYISYDAWISMYSTFNCYTVYRDVVQTTTISPSFTCTLTLSLIRYLQSVRIYHSDETNIEIIGGIIRREIQSEIEFMDQQSDDLQLDYHFIQFDDLRY